MIAPPWWERRETAWALVLLSIVPLLWPSLPPFADLPGHIGRFHIASSIAKAPDLARHWQFEWALIGNLGVDLLVHALAPLTGVELGARIAVTLIPPLWVSGLILVSRSADGRLSPAAALAFPLAYSFPFQFGFVNFMLSAALAFHALALWIWLGRRERIALRTALFVPISCVLWVAHSAGWGLFGLIAFAAEFARLRGRRGWLKSALAATAVCLPLALPLLWMLGAPATGRLVEWDFKAKASWLPALLRERWKWYDVASAIILFSALWLGVRDRRLRFDAMLGLGTVAALFSFLLLPRLALGGAYIDMRMLAPGVALALIAIRVRPGNPRFGSRLALAAAVFLVVRTVGTTIAMALFAQGQQQAVQAITHIPRGAAVLVLVNEPCTSTWTSRRLSHIAGLAVARRDIFENSQWTLSGQQLLRHRHPAAEPFTADPSQLIYPEGCDYRLSDFETALRAFDRHTFTHVWTLDFPARARLAPDVRRIWSNDVSALYAVDAPSSRLPERQPAQ